MMDLTALLPFATRRRATQAAPRRARAGFRPGLDPLEGRLVLSHVMPAIAHHHVAAHVHALAAPVGNNIKLPVNLTNVNITSITRDATTGVLNLVGTATGTILGQQFTTPLTGTITPPKNAKSCPVLDLHLGPINLSVLGLNVNTSQICLNINAQKGRGLLGNLLCGGLTNVVKTAATSTTDAATQATSLLNNQQLLNNLNKTLTQAKTHLASFSPAAGTTCPVLNLNLGPVRLNLLGLKVKLDNCANGPVNVNVTATQNGGLLGNLVCGLTGNPTGRTLFRTVNSLLQQITNTPLPTV